MPDSDELLAQVRSAAELLERMEGDRAPLEQLPAEERERLQRAVAAFYHPDPVARRRRLKAAERERAAERAERVGTVLRRRESGRCGGSRCLLLPSFSSGGLRRNSARLYG